MPLRDHFHPPWNEENPWDGFHSAWANTMVRHLNGSLLPRGYRAFPQISLGPHIETDVATRERLSAGGVASSSEITVEDSGVAAWSPPEAVQTLDVEPPGEEVFEVRVQDIRRARLVAAVELVSPGNKDRPSERQAFVAKCAAYLQERVGVVIIDVITTRRANMHRELLQLLSAPPPEGGSPDLYCVSYRRRMERNRWRLDTWPFPLAVGSPLPTTVPLWIAGTFAVPLNLEATYEETEQVLRIE